MFFLFLAVVHQLCYKKLIYCISLHNTNIFREELLMGKNPDGVNGRLFRLLLEYLKDSNRSDKQMAKVMGVSEPTIARMKRRLVEDGLVEHFSVIPNFSKIGYEILAFSCVKFNPEKLAEIEGKAKEWAQRNHEIIFTSRAEGMGMHAVTISLHKNYAEYDKYLRKNKIEWRGLLEEVHFMLVDLKGENTKPFSLRSLAEKQKK